MTDTKYMYDEFHRFWNLFVKSIREPGKTKRFIFSKIHRPLVSYKTPYLTEESLLNSQEVKWKNQPDEIQFQYSLNNDPEPVYNSFLSGLYPRDYIVDSDGGISYQPPDRFIKIWKNTSILKSSMEKRKRGVIYFNQDGDVIGPLINSTAKRNKSSLVRRASYLPDQIGTFEFLKYLIGKPDLEKCECIDTAVCLASRTSMIYGHWLLEYLPKLIMVTELLGHSPKVILKPPTSWQRETLDILGVPEDDRIQLKTRPIHVENFIQTDIKPVYSRDFELCREAYRTMSEIMKKSIDLNGDFAERIFVSRQKVGRRYIKNIDEVEAVLDNYGINIIYPEKMSIKQQIRQFHNAKVIVGPTGSGLTNMIFSENAKIYPIIDSSWISGLYFALSQVMNHDCYPIYFDSEKANLHKLYSNKNESRSNIRVDINVLSNILDETLNVRI